MICHWCEEQIENSEASHVAGLHRECAIRSVVGSLGHQLRLCSCYATPKSEGLDDPPGMTRREAARIASSYSGLRAEMDRRFEQILRVGGATQ